MAALPLARLVTAVLLLTQGSVLPTNGQKISFGSCPTVTGITSFVQANFVGVWYEAQRYNNIFEFGKRCVEWNFAATSGTTMTATTTMRDWFSNTKTMIGTMTAGTPPAKFAYTITQLPGFFFGVNRNYDLYVVATDYTSYAVLWTCRNQVFKNEQMLWVLTKNRVPTTAILNTARTAVTSAGLTTNWLVSTPQTSC